MFQKRRMTNDDVISAGGCLLIFLTALILFLPITGLLVILTRGWSNTPAWFRGLWILSIVAIGGVFAYSVGNGLIQRQHQDNAQDAVLKLSTQYVSSSLSDQLYVKIRMVNNDSQMHELCPLVETVMAIPASTAADKTLLFASPWFTSDGQRFCYRIPANGAADGVVGLGGRYGYSAGDYSASDVSKYRLPWKIIQMCIYPNKVDGYEFSSSVALQHVWRQYGNLPCQSSDNAYIGKTW